MISSKTFLAAAFFCAFTILNAADIYMAGDSTMCNYPEKRAPRAGWGQVLQNYCKPGVKVVNLAIPGYSTKTFVDKKKWDNLVSKLKPGDFVIIQFGHNDQKKKYPQQYASAGGTYNEYFKRFAADVRAKKCHPVFATSIVRRQFKKGELKDLGNLREYAEAVIATGKEINVPVIDLNEMTRAKVAELGSKKSLPLYMSSQPKTKTDNTHITFEGANMIAGMFVNEAKKQKLPIAELFK